jgi:hypothetical protein
MQRPEGLKNTFHEERSSLYNGGSLLAEASRLSGISVERLAELRDGGVKLTELEYAKMGRCPAQMLPEGFVSDKLAVLHCKFSSECVDTGPSMEDWAEIEKGNWERIHTDKVLAKPDGVMKPFIRMTPRRLLQAITIWGCWNDELREVARRSFNEAFNTIRYTATVAHFLVGSDAASAELLYMLRRGGYVMTGPEWISATKPHHAVVKATRRTLTNSTIISSDLMSEFLYFPSLAGRDLYINDAATLDQIEKRTKVKSDYVGYDRLSETFRSFCVGRWSDLMKNTDKVKKPTGWSDFIKRLYLKMPSGACNVPPEYRIDFNAIGGIRGLKEEIDGVLRGNKRFRAELQPIRHFDEFGKWFVGAFLKFEVGKNRWLYPAEFEYIVLGLFMLDSIIDAFFGVSGVDLGHDLYGSVATKLDVLRELNTGACCVNTDGKGFDENHTIYDMCSVYEAVRETVTLQDTPRADYHDVMRAIDKYESSIVARDVKFRKYGDSKVERVVELTNTLFSGEAPTSFVNTMIIGTAAMYAVASMATAGLLFWVKLFFKGDDLNAFMPDWISCFVVLKWIERIGVELEPAKDHIEIGQCEHERCIVTLTRYWGSICRRVGAMVAAEPQGALVLTLNEAINSMNENRMSLVARGAKVKGASVLMYATLMTYINKPNVPKALWKMLGVPKVNGGFGCWFDGKWGLKNVKAPPEIRTDFVQHEDSKLRDFGSAKMTDAMIETICDEYNVHHDLLKEEREAMIGDSAMTGLGPTKYGSRRYKNIDDVIEKSKRFRMVKLDHATLNGYGRTLAQNLGMELRKLLTNPKSLRHCNHKTPQEVAMATISRLGLLNIQVYKKVKGYSNERQLYRDLTSNPETREEAVMIEALWRRGMDVALIFIKGDLNLTFWAEDEMINTEVAALVQKFTICGVAAATTPIGLETNKQLNLNLHWEILTTEVARVVWRMNSDILSRISF